MSARQGSVPSAQQQCRPCREGQHPRCLRVDGGSCNCVRGACRARSSSAVPAAKASTRGASDGTVFTVMLISQIVPGLNVRLTDDTGLPSLAESIRQHGVLQPITVVPTARDRFECLFGHRRLAASKLAGRADIPCIVRPRGASQTRVLVQIAENLRRKDMTVLEEARAFDELRKLGMSVKEIAANVGMGDGGVRDRLELLRYPEVVQMAVHRRSIYIKDALSIPLDLAYKTDGRTLAATLRRGSAAMREWLRQQAADGSKSTRRHLTAVGMEFNLYDEVKAAADADRQTIVEWVADACRARLKERVA